MTGGPYREGESRTGKLTRVVYSISPWAAVVILIMQVTVLGTAATIIRGPERVVKVVRVMARPAQPLAETMEQRSLTRQQDVALCTRACCGNFVSVKRCNWRQDGVRACDCKCSGGAFNLADENDVEEQR